MQHGPQGSKAGHLTHRMAHVHLGLDHDGLAREQALGAARIQLERRRHSTTHGLRVMPWGALSAEDKPQTQIWGGFGHGDRADEVGSATCYLQGGLRPSLQKAKSMRVD
jgi:hypothetical protein